MQQRSLAARADRAGLVDGLPAPPSASALENVRISVFVRKRPMLPDETKAGNFDVVTPSNRDVGPSLVMHEPKTLVDLSKVRKHRRGVVCRDGV